MGDKLFISYRREDVRASTESIYRALLPVFGRDQIFFDVDSIPGGVNFPDMIQQVLAQCAVMLVIVGPKWLDIAKDGVRRLDDPGDYVRLEVKTALDAGLRVIPVLMEEARMPHAEQLPEALRQFALMNARPVRYAPDFDVDIGRLVKAIEEGGAPALAVRQARAQEAARLAQTEAERQRLLAYQQDLARQQAAWQPIQEEQTRQAAAAAAERKRQERAARPPLPWLFALVTSVVMGAPAAVVTYLLIYFGHLDTANSSVVPDGFGLNESLFCAVLCASFVLPGVLVASYACRGIWRAPREIWFGNLPRSVVFRATGVGTLATAIACGGFGIGEGWGALRTLANPNVYAAGAFIGLFLGSIIGAIVSVVTALLLLLARRVDLMPLRHRDPDISTLPRVRLIMGLGIGLLCGLPLGAIGYLAAVRGGAAFTAPYFALYAVAAIVPAGVTVILGRRAAPAMFAAIVCAALFLAAWQYGAITWGTLHLNPHDVNDQVSLFMSMAFGAVGLVLAGAPIGLLAGAATLLVRSAAAGRRAPVAKK